MVGVKRNPYLPDFEKCPAPSSHLNTSMLLSVFISLSFATHLAGSEYITLGSVGQTESIKNVDKSETNLSLS